MTCAWKELLGILPPWLRGDTDVLGKDGLQELRLRVNSPPELVLNDGIRYLSRIILKEDIQYVINCASKYSPWAAASVSKGYLTAPGGHRIGLCGEAVVANGTVMGIREVTSVNIRVARDYPVFCDPMPLGRGSVLILGAPGWGKTTLLRALIRMVCEKETVAVVDERGELFPIGFHRKGRMDILTGTSKASGMEMVLRTMGPAWIAVDEITAEEDCKAILDVNGCGVRMMATAHASSLEDFRCRNIYRPLVQHNVFQTVFLLRPDKSFLTERIYA